MTIGIILKTINNETYNLNVPIDLPIPELKLIVRQSTSIPEDRQRLIYRGHVLQDENALNDYKIEDGHTIHMVARPADYEELRSQISRNETQNTTRNTLQSFLGLSPFGNESLFNQPSSLLQNSETTEQNTNEIPTSLEPIRQTLLTTHTLLSTINQNNNQNFQIRSSNNPSRKYFVGQWLDVRDTVNQWLEATIMIVDNDQERLFIHYNGWPTRWDEWIVFSSPRLAPFRTRTANITVNTSCPAPTHTVAHAPLTGPDDIRILIPEMNRLVQLLQPMLNIATSLCDETLNTTQNSTVNSEINYAEGMPWDKNISHENNLSSDQMEDGKTHGLLDHESDEMSQALPNEDTDAKLKQMLSEICPLFDRLGRAMTDISPHLQKYAQPPNTNTNTNTNTTSSQNNSSNSLPFPLGFSLGSLLSRPNRPPSPPADSFFRAPITNPVRSNNLGQTNTNHLDIHIHAILTPLRVTSNQETSREVEGSSTSNTSNQRSSGEETSNSLLTPLLPSNIQTSMDQYNEDDFSSLQPESVEIQSQQSNPSLMEMRKDDDNINDSYSNNDLDILNEYQQTQIHSPQRLNNYHQRNQQQNRDSQFLKSSDENESNSNLKMKSKSPSKYNSNSENDWRTSGRSKEHTTSLLKKRSEPTGSSMLSSSNEYDNNTLEHRKVPVSHSTRREMRGLMKAIDTASSDHNSQNHHNYRERKEARILGDKLNETPNNKSILKKSSISNSTSTTTSPTTSLTTTTTISPTTSQNTSLNTITPNTSSSFSSSFLRSETNSPKKSDQTETLNRHSHQESLITPEPQVQTRQANAENSFIQRVRRSLSFRQSQLQKQNSKQS